MESLLLYLFKLIVCSGVMFLYYQLSLKDKTFHHYNRFYLLGNVAVSILLPLIKIEYFTVEVNENVYALLSKFQYFNNQKPLENDISYYRIFLTILELVAFFLVAKLLVGIFKILRFKKEFPQHKMGEITFYETNLKDAPFSFFKNLFWKDGIDIKSDVGKQILKHEMVHIEQNHSWDKLFVEVSTAIFWFNPFFYFIKKELYLIHEYLADHKAVKKSDTKAFAQMLLASHFTQSSLPMTSPFLNSNLKKRLKMLQKPKTKYSYIRRLLALPVLFAIGFIYLVNAENKKIAQINGMSLKKDTISPKVTVTAELVEVGASDPVATVLKEADETSIYLIDGKEVKKTDFESIYNKKPAHYYFVHSVASNQPGKSIFSAEKMDDENAKKTREKFLEEFSRGKIVNGSNDYSDAIQVQEDAKQVAIDVKQALKDTEEAERETKQALKYSIKAAQDTKNTAENSEKIRKQSERISHQSKKVQIQSELIRKEAEKIRQENSDLTRSVGMEKVGNVKSLWVVVSDVRKSNDDQPAPKDPRLPFYTSRNNTNSTHGNTVKSYDDYDVYVDGKMIDKADFKKIDPKAIQSINVYKNDGRARLEVKLK